jgi:hypothetical protein
MTPFRRACKRGDLAEAQRLFGLGGVHIHADNADSAFWRVCRNGHLSVAQWLFSLGGVDIHAHNDAAFRWACCHGHLVVAQWLLSLGGVDIHAKEDFAFRVACAFPANWVVGRWLCALEPEWPWPAGWLRKLQVWTPSRDAWMRAVPSRNALAQSMNPHHNAL